MRLVSNQSLSQIKEATKKETIQKLQNLIDKFNQMDCKLNLEFNKQICNSSKIYIYKVTAFILPSNISKNEAFKNHNIKCFTGKILKIQKIEDGLCIKKYKDVFFSLYLKIMLVKLNLFGKEKFFKEGLLDLFIKVFFQNRADKLSNSFRGHDISFIPIVLFVIFMLIAALISAYFDIKISRNLGWW